MNQWTIIVDIAYVPIDYVVLTVLSRVTGARFGLLTFDDNIPIAILLQVLEPWMEAWLIY